MNMPVFCAWLALIMEYLAYYIPRVCVAALVVACAVIVYNCAFAHKKKG